MAEHDDVKPAQPAPVLRADPGDDRRRAMAAAAAGSVPGRRGALYALAGTAFFSLAIVVPRPAGDPEMRRGESSRTPAQRRLSLVLAHTGETFADVFAEDERYDPDKLARLSRLLRDSWNGQVKPIDPALFDVLARVQAQVGQPLRVLSGYRSWRTNRFMRIVGFDVAEHSQHVAGKAVDFTVPGIAPAALGEIARRCGAGGVGVYRSGFVHVDTGPQRHWTGN